MQSSHLLILLLGTTYTFGDHGRSSTGTDNDNDFGTRNDVEINGVSLIQFCEEGYVGQ
ncbi:hypothetical protein V1509DRAFT_624626 [Lipomyces kononenkoae]